MEYIKSAFNSLRESIRLSRELRRADTQARYLITNNKDFRNVSHSDLVRAIMSDKPLSIKEIGHEEARNV